MRSRLNMVTGVRVRQFTLLHIHKTEGYNGSLIKPGMTKVGVMRFGETPK